MQSLAFHKHNTIQTIADIDINALGVYQKRELASNSSTPAETLTMLAKDGDEYVRQTVASNSSTPAETLAMLANDSNSDVRWAVASNPSTLAETLAMLAKDSERDIRWAVADNPSTPVEVLTMLAKDSDAGARRVVARNPLTPVEVLVMLAKDNDALVRQAVAGNSSTPAEVLTMLANDRDKDIRIKVAGNPLTPVEVLAMLAEDSYSLVREKAKAALQERTILDNATTLSKQEMRDKGFAGKESFDHKATDSLAKAVPGYTLNAKGQNWVKYIYADDAGNEFPAELFQAFNLSHGGSKLPLGNGKPLGWIGGKYDARTSTLYITEMQSDLLQRTYELNDAKLAQFKQYKSRLENRFSGWYYVFMNQAMRYAKELNVSKVALPTTAFYTKNVEGAKNIAGIYEKVLANYQHVNEGNWNVIEMAGVQKLAFHKH